MERESTKHGRRLDGQLRHETASVVTGAPVPARSREDHRQEDPGEGLDTIGKARPEVPDPGQVTEEEAAARAELARVVATARFPARARDLLTAAARGGGDEAVLAELSALPEESAFPTLQALWETLGGNREERDGKRA